MDQEDLLTIILGVPDMSEFSECKHGKMEGTPADQALRDIKAILDKYFADEKCDDCDEQESTIEETEVC